MTQLSVSSPLRISTNEELVRCESVCDQSFKSSKDFYKCERKVKKMLEDCWVSSPLRISTNTIAHKLTDEQKKISFKSSKDFYKLPYRIEAFVWVSNCGFKSSKDFYK